MKRQLLIISSLLLLLLSSCSHSFYNTRQHAHRNYIKIGPGIKQERVDEAMDVNHMSVVSVKSDLNVTVPHQSSSPILVNSKLKSHQNPSNRTIQSTSVKKTSFFTKVIDKYMDIFKSKKKLGHSPKPKKTNATPVLNILGFVFGLISILLLLAAFIVAIASTLYGGVILTAVTMYYIVLGTSIFGLALSIMGVAMDHPRRGFGIAGIITNGIALFLVFLALLIWALFP